MKRTLKENLHQLELVKKLHCQPGNWNFDPYMHGLTNGIILSLALLQNRKPKFKTAPKKWIRDKKITKLLEVK